MKKTAALLLALLLLFTAAAAETFNFRSGVTWGMKPSAVRGCEQLTDAQDYSINGYTVVLVPQANVSRYAARLLYLFDETGLKVAFYDFVDETVDDTAAYAYLTSALAGKYGEPSEDAAPIAVVLDQIAPGKYPEDEMQGVSCWTLEDDTLVAIVRYTDDAFMILYAAPGMAE